MSSNKRNKRTDFQSKFAGLDKFNESVQLNYDGGKSKFKTDVGALITLAELIAILAFSVQRILLMSSRDNTTITSYLEYDATASNKVVFGSDQNFTFAFGISDIHGVDVSQD
jgi:hypothetical protein